MPRGYLKHETSLNRKVRRGGGSHARRRKQQSRKWTPKYGEDFSISEDYLTEDSYNDCEEFNKAGYDNDGGDYAYQQYTPRLSECPICLEEKECMKLMKTCKHAPACYDCLYEHYVARADLSLYPLTCFYCRRPLHDVHIQKLAKTKAEVMGHYFLQFLRKSLRKLEQIVQELGAELGPPIMLTITLD